MSSGLTPPPANRANTSAGPSLGRFGSGMNGGMGVGGARPTPPPIPQNGFGNMGGGGRQPHPSMDPAFGPTVTLSIVYQGEKLPVSKERFVIGRGRQSSDLTLKDPNVSRQHAMIEFQNGVYFMVDMGSTNGVEYNGQRIARKQIAEGDTFRICDHDIRFTYR